MLSDLQVNLIGRVAVGDIFRRRALATPNKEAIVEKRGEEFIRLTFKELNDAMNRFARAARSLGLQQGDRIGLLGPNSVEYLIALYGCAKGGFVAVPVNPGLSPGGILYILEHAEVKALIADDALQPIFDEITAKAPLLQHCIIITATRQHGPGAPFIDFQEFMRDQSDDEIEDVIINDRDIFEILYTSGTTADPKGVMVTHLSVFIMSLTCPIELKMSRDLVGTTLMPLFHCAQQTITTSYAHIGAKTVIFRGFDPTVMLEAVEREKIGIIFSLPAMYRAMLDHPRLKEFDLSSAKCCIYAMTPMDKRTLEQATKAFGAEFVLGTGQTEFFPASNTFRPGWPPKEGNYWGESAVTVDSAVMDESGRLLPSGQTGEIVWRGPAVMAGYLKNREATEEACRYGWHHSGDIGYMDEDGLLVFVDRKKDMIKTGGENVSSLKVERVILSDPRVAAVAVVGLPHERWVEAVTAFVQPRDGVSLAEEDVISLCKGELGRFEVPKKVVLVNDLPRTSTGKMQKHVIRNIYRNLYA